MRIAFIGLGNMGAPMARNLIKAGHQLNLFDLNKTVLAEPGRTGRADQPVAQGRGGQQRAWSSPCCRRRPMCAAYT